MCVCYYYDTYDHFIQLSAITIIMLTFFIVIKGTAKTTICTSIASYLGWNFLTIDTASFLADGLQNVASRMSYIFDRLKVLERSQVPSLCWCVIALLYLFTLFIYLRLYLFFSFLFFHSFYILPLFHFFFFFLFLSLELVYTSLSLLSLWVRKYILSSLYFNAFYCYTHLAIPISYHPYFIYLYSCRTIILFDEIEEFCLDRENPSLGMESRMLTTAMLTQVREVSCGVHCVCVWARERESVCVWEREEWWERVRIFLWQ